ncbi:MAG: hydroxymethylglutaryl-CoA reductase, degradative, partial [Legionellales bacterium]|nr:hydroxymethylglutaryl-CoA reductase, degradative [Legionellales bacterium]
KIDIINNANSSIAMSLQKRGGGVTDIQIKHIQRTDDYDMGVIHVLVNTCDAMGANIITQICEYLKPIIENLTNESVNMCILSNLSDDKLTKATVTIKNIDPDLGNKIQEASLFAELDPYRAATNNKGVLNGIDPILIATGNDWRCVEAGVHGYAARSGQYKAITSWKMKGRDLIGEIIAPINVGTVGGVTKLHPMAKMSLNMMKIKSASHLSRVIAAVGLVQNLGAITALTTVGLVKGHMKLHISNLSLNAGAKAEELPILQKKLEELLKLRKMITLTNAIEILKDLRSNKITKQTQTA